MFAGIWPEGADGTDINAVDRSRDHKLVATADDFGRVNVFGWPCFHAKVDKVLIPLNTAGDIP